MKKILQICNFSSGISGIWSRVLQDSKEFIKKGYEVYVFSSNLESGTEKIVSSNETIGNIKIFRFSVNRKKGYALWFDFQNQALDLKPDIIICHGFRKPYLSQSIKIAKKINAKIFLVTHAPFLEKGLRNWKLSIAVKFYDKLFSKKILNSFNKIITITKWEIPYLLKLGAKKEKIIYIPNSIPNEFYKKSTKGKNILFLGRISHVKSIETIIKALNKKSNLTIVGPAEQEYKKRLNLFIRDLNLEKQIKFLPPIFDLRKKIKIYDQHEIFILPSKREGLPVSLIEAMARGKIVISSTTQGGKELVQNNKNGFLFEIGNSKQLTRIIEKIQKMPEKEKQKIRKEARKTAEQFKSSEIIKKYEGLL